jgi:hypothetical protein
VSCSRLDEWLAAARVDPPARLADTLEEIARSYAEPGPWLAFTHGDPAPTNNHVRGGEVRLLDFEYGGYRHALYDPTAWNVLCPMPDETLPAIASAYREVIVPAMPVAADDRAFAAAWGTMCAYRSIAILGWIPATVFAADALWVGDWTMRAAALGTAIRLHEAIATIPELESLAETASRLGGALSALWPEAAENLRPSWPAFAQSVVTPAS